MNIQRLSVYPGVQGHSVGLNPRKLPIVGPISSEPLNFCTKVDIGVRHYQTGCHEKCLGSIFKVEITAGQS